MKGIEISGRPIGVGRPPFVIAEMSGNHNQSLERALEIVDAAAASGAHALKIQTYTPDTMTLDLNEREFHISDPASLWRGRSLYELYGDAQTPWEWHEPIFARARELGIIPFSSPFDATAVEFLESLDTPCYKIASFENVDIALIERVAATGKPVIISTGMATKEEIGDAVDAARGAGCDELLLLKCTSSYPATAENANILSIPDMRKRFGCEIGLSDHTLGIGVALASVSLGAVAIEKHFTLSRADGGVDSAFSMEPHEFRQLVVETGRAAAALGQPSYGPGPEEQGSLAFRRSLYIVEDVRAGDVLTRENIRAIRPGLGLAPKHLPNVLGKVMTKDAKRGTPLAWELIG